MSQTNQKNFKGGSLADIEEGAASVGLRGIDILMAACEDVSDMVAQIKNDIEAAHIDHMFATLAETALQLAAATDGWEDEELMAA